MRKVKLMFVIAVVLAVFAIGNQVLAGQVITVDDDGPTDYYTIQDAIDAAVDGDVVVVADGTYSGEGNRDIDFAGKAIMLQSENGPDNCIIDCDGTENEPHRGFYFHNGEDANSIVDGFTITKGYATATSPFDPILPGSSVVPSQPLGGAIYCNNASLTITNCNIIGNRASVPYGEQGLGYQIGLSSYSAGGGIHCLNSNAIINNCTIAENKAENSAERLGSSNGGGIYCGGNGEVTITNCIVTGNEAFAPVGPITPTGNPLDMAIGGEGYFVLDDGERNIFTRRGAFSVNANAILVDQKTGYHVQRIGSAGEADGFQIPSDSNICMPFDMPLPPKGTSAIVVQGNLSAEQTLPVSQTQVLRANISYTVNGYTAPAHIKIADLDQFSGAFNGNAGITISGYEHDGTALTDGGGLTVNAATDMGNLITYINSRLQAGSGTDKAALSNGRIVITDGSPGYSQSDVKLTYTDAGDDTSLTMPGYFEISTVGGEEVKNVNITIYDSIGGQHVLSASFVRTNIPNTWDMILSSIGDDISSVTFDNRRIEGIEFNGLDGSYTGLNAAIGDIAEFTITFKHDTSNPQVIAIDLGTPEQFDGLTQFTGNSTAVAKEQDGYQPGRLSTVSVNGEGVIIGTFSNDIERDIARIQLALFNEPNALDPISHDHFIPTPASGSPIATAPGDNGAGTILGGYLENLNDDRYAPQGQIVYTDRKLDAAIDGDGYFVVNDGLQNLFTRIGSFDSDVNSMLLDPATGYRVQRIGSAGEENGYQIPGDSNIYISYDMLAPANPTSEIIVGGNLSADDSYGEKNTNILIYDSQGGRHVLSAMFVRTEIHTWDLVLTSVTGEIEPLADRRIEGITFNGPDGSYNGLMNSNTEVSFNIEFPFAPGTFQTISFFFGTVGQFDGLTQFAGQSTAVARQQDGYQAGQLSSVSVDRDGSIIGAFSNGIRRNLATIQLALFQNPEYLENLNNGYFAATTASGQPVAAQPGDNGAGTIIPIHLEDPNADRYFMQWKFISTGQPFDLAVWGERYYFVLNDGSQDIFTRIGSFDIDADEMLAEPVRGFKVQRIGSVGEENGYQVPGDSNIYISYDMLIPPKPTSKIVVRGNLSSDASHGEKDIGITIYDSQGDWHVLSATFVRTEIPNTWELVINSVTGEIAPSAERCIEGITFNPQEGSYSGLNGGEPTFDVKFPFDPGAIQTISFFFGTPGQFNGLTQFARSSTAAAREQDGYTEGVLSSVSVSNEGTLVGAFSNGVKSDIAQIKIATFPAPWALETIDHGYFVSTPTSGEAIATQTRFGSGWLVYDGTLLYPRVNVHRNGNSFGGGIYCTSSAIIKNCLITDNSSDNGGGLYCQTDTTFENCTISGNSAVNTGGGIYCSIITGPMETFNLPLLLPAPADTVITNSILSDNIAEQGPQLALESVGIWLTPTGIGEPDSKFEPVFPGLRIAYSNIQSGEQGVLIEYDNSLILDQGNIDEYPCFVDAANGDYRLLSDSPCINSGDPNYIPEVNETDLDGNPRVIGGRIDMGVYEMSDPAVLFGFLYQNIVDFQLQKGIENALLAKLDTSLQKIADENKNNDITAINSLQAFIKAVEAQRGKKISEADADVLIAAAQEILELLKKNQS